MIPPSIRSRERRFLAAIGILALFLSGKSVRGDETLETLWKDYQAYGLPVPSAEAELGLLPGPETRGTGADAERDYYLVFRVKKADQHGLPVYWIGCEEGPRWPTFEIRPTNAAKVNLKETVPIPNEGFSEQHPGFQTYPDLALAVQCHARGWDDLANALLERSKKREKANPFKMSKPRPHDDQTALAELAWNYNCNRFAREKGDRRPLVARLKQLLATPHHIDTKARRNIVADMEKTLERVKTTPGSPEAALEGLLDLTVDQDEWQGTNRDDFRNNAADDPNYKKLLDLGMDAVPLLMRHLDDFRMTRQMWESGLRSYSWHMRVADVVAQLLDGLVDEQFAYDFLETEGRGIQLDRNHVAAWWKEASGQQELAYLLKHLERKDEYGRMVGNPSVLNALGARYPAELEKQFEQRLKANKMGNNWFEALAASNMSVATKSRLLLAAATRTDECHQILGLRQLAKMKQLDTAKLLIAALERQPKTPEVCYCESNIGNLTQIAMEIDDEQLWETLAKTAKRVDIGQRFEMFDAIGRCKRNGHEKHAISFLKSWLDDAEIRDESSSFLFRGTFAGFQFGRIAVRDFAAIQLAYLLDLESEPNSHWKEEDWAKLRELVKAKVAEVEKSQGQEKKR
jgi:hypothetical protein